MKTHGLRKSPIGNTWSSMVTRCFNQNSGDYKRYGAKGITACDFLRKSPWSIIESIGNRPSLDYSIDRINNSGSYTCGKCEQCTKNGWVKNIRWATDIEQANNKFRN